LRAGSIQVEDDEVEDAESIQRGAHVASRWNRDHVHAVPFQGCREQLANLAVVVDDEDVAGCVRVDGSGRADGGRRELTADHRPGKQVVATAALGQRVQVHTARGIAGKRKPSPLLEEGRKADLELRVWLGDGGVRRQGCLR
jgi:hypothetical protein